MELHTYLWATATPRRETLQDYETILSRTQHLFSSCVCLRERLRTGQIAEALLGSYLWNSPHLHRLARRNSVLQASGLFSFPRGHALRHSLHAQRAPADTEKWGGGLHSKNNEGKDERAWKNPKKAD